MSLVEPDDHALADTCDEFVRHAIRAGVRLRGHHNQNFVLPLTEELARHVECEVGTPVTVRIRRPETLPVVVRTWPREWEVLDAVGRVLPHRVPRCLAVGREASIHSYVDGVPLSALHADGTVVHRVLVEALIDLMARMAQVGREALPPLPADWPSDDRDSRGFLRLLTAQVEHQVREPNWPVFGQLFVTLGVPEGAMRRFADRLPAMTGRPFALLHADLHRDNVIVTPSGAPPLVCVDWELATYGDPLHDLAIHLVRMRYPKPQREQVINVWCRAVRRASPDSVDGVARDLRHYIEFERAQSVYPDVVRAAQSLTDHADHPGRRELARSTAMVRKALKAATGPLALDGVPDVADIERALEKWCRFSTSAPPSPATPAPRRPDAPPPPPPTRTPPQQPPATAQPRPPRRLGR